MKIAIGATVFALVLTLESVAIVIALGGATAGTLALLLVWHNARKLEAFVVEQTSTVASLRTRVEALEPHPRTG